MVAFAGGDDLLLVFWLANVDMADSRTDRASVMSEAVDEDEETLEDEDALSDAFAEGEGLLVVLAEAEDGWEACADFALACVVSTMVTETETVVASGSLASEDFVTV